jgi:hypothetical protein
MTRAPDWESSPYGANGGEFRFGRWKPSADSAIGTLGI